MGEPVAPRSWSLWIALLVVQACFGSLSVAGKFAFRELSPTALAALRVATAAIILVALERLVVPRARPRPTARDLGPLAAFAMLGVVVNQTLFLEGLQRTTAVNATLLVTTIPAFTMLVALALGRERAHGRVVLGVGLSLLGVVLLVGLDALALGGRFLLGNVMVTVNALSYSVYLVVSRPYLQRFDPLTVVAYTFGVGALVMLAAGAPALLATDVGALSRTTWAALAWMITMGTVVTYGLNNWVLRYLDSSTVAAFIPLQPLVAAMLAVPLLDESLSWRTLVSGAVILAGVVIAARAAHSLRAGKPI